MELHQVWGLAREFEERFINFILFILHICIHKGGQESGAGKLPRETFKLDYRRVCEPCSPVSIFILVLEAPKSASRRIEDYGEEDEFGAKDFSKELSLKADHQNRPLWIVRN